MTGLRMSGEIYQAHSAESAGLDEYRMQNHPWVQEEMDGLRTELSTEQKISRILLGLGIPAHVKGYRFLEEAVITAMKESEWRLMRDVYALVAQKYHTTAVCVERSIRSAIQIAWVRGRPGEGARLLGRSVSISYERPTNSELIALMAEHMRLYH